MTEDWGKILQAKFAKEQSWAVVGEFVSKNLASSYNAGYQEGKKTKGIVALEALLETLR